MRVTATALHKESLESLPDDRNIRTIIIHHYSPSKFASAPHTLHCADNPLDPRKLSWVFANCTFDFFTVFVPPDAVFLGSKTVEMGVCSPYQ
jgi:hypothetical protein